MTTPCCEATDLVLCNQQKEPGPGQMTAEMETLQHMEQHRRACASPMPSNSKGTGELGFQQDTETQWRKQFLCSVTTEQSMVWMVKSPWTHLFKCCEDTGACPTELTEIEAIQYLRTEWIWTNLLTKTLHLL